MTADGEQQRPGLRPRPTLGRRLDIAARHALPACSTILLMLLTAAPLGLYGQAALLPAVTLVSVWFWSLFWPDAMPPPAVFLIGVLLDLLAWQPIGSGVLILLIVHGLARHWQQPLTARGFALLWAGFAVIAVGAATLGWALTAVLTWRLLPPAPAVFQAVVSIAIYPALAMVLGKTHRSAANPERA